VRIPSIVTALAVLVAVIFGNASPAFASGDDINYGTDTTDSGEIVVIGQNPGGAQLPSQVAETAGSFTVTAIVTGCSEFDSIPCATEMATYCTTAPPDGPTDRWRVSTTQVFASTDVARLIPLSTTTGCMNFYRAPGVDAGPSEADVREVMTTLIPTSGAGTSPAPDASGMAQFVVNLPLIVYAVGRAEVTAGPVPLVGHNVEVSASAVSYAWSAGGSALVTAQPGRAYDGSSCTRLACDAYVHLDPFTATGQYRLALTTTWAGRYRIDGGAWIDIADPIEKTSAPTVLNLREARGVLVYN
jgi:hypothetical protein